MLLQVFQSWSVQLATVFFSYSHADEAPRDELEKHLALLKRQSIIQAWHDRRIGAGSEIDGHISSHIESDDIILLLVSSDFLASDYCYDREMLRAMERHESGEAIVIPVILRACDWHGAPFGKLNASPTDGLPITQWPDRDQAFLEVTRAIRDAVGRLENSEASAPAYEAESPAPTKSSPMGTQGSHQSDQRSSNLRLTKEFSQRDKDRFKQETFDYLAKFFENSLSELSTRNDGIEGDFRRVDGNRLTAKVYRNGDAVTACTIFMSDGMFGNGIAFSHNVTSESNSMNEALTVDADEQAMFLRSFGMSSMAGRGQDQKLTQEGAAEKYWSMLIEATSTVSPIKEMFHAISARIQHRNISGGCARHTRSCAK